MQQSDSSKICKLASLAIAVTCMASPASAKILQQTSYNYFKIQGQTAREIYQSLLQHAKSPSGHDAYATTAIQVFQNSSFVGSSPCSIQKVKLNATFKITLPKLHTTGLAPNVNQTWRSFETALMTHEQHHRTLWMACVAKLERQVQALKAGSCSALSAKFKSIWKSIEAECTMQNNRFDKSEQVAILKQPFIKLVQTTRR